MREQTLATLGGWGARQLANLAHALEKLKARRNSWSSLWEAVARASLRRMREFTPQALANTAWPFATAGHASPALLDVIAVEAEPRVRELNLQALANTGWAYAKAGHAAPDLLNAITAEAAPRVRNLNLQDLATTALAYATAGRAAPELLGDIAAEVAPRVREFNGTTRRGRTRLPAALLQSCSAPSRQRRRRARAS